MSIDIAKAVRLLLVGDVTVAQLVADRVYIDRLPQGVVPDRWPSAVLMQDIGTLVGFTHDGPGGERMRLQIDAFATDRDTAFELGEAIFEALCPERAGNMPGFRRVVGGVEIQFVNPGIRRSGHELDTKLHFRGGDYLVTAAAAGG